MFNLEKFIADSVTNRPVSMFAADIEANKETLTAEIKGKKVCVIGGAGSIGSSFIKAVLRFEPASVVVVGIEGYIVLKHGFQEVQERALARVAFFRYQ